MAVLTPGAKVSFRRMPPPPPRAARRGVHRARAALWPVAVLGARDILDVFNHQVVFGFSVDENRGCIIHERGFPRQTESHRKSLSEGARQLRTRTRDPTVVLDRVLINPHGSLADVVSPEIVD